MNEFLRFSFKKKVDSYYKLDERTGVQIKGNGPSKIFEKKQ